MHSLSTKMGGKLKLRKASLTLVMHLEVGFFFKCHASHAGMAVHDYQSLFQFIPNGPCDLQT